MIEDARQQPGKSQPPSPRNCTPDPATQPPPVPTGRDCPDLPTTTPPTPCEPTHECPLPPCCPKPPDADSTCIDRLIEEQQKDIAKSEGAKAFKADLEALLQKVKTAKAEYTDEKYRKLREQWEKQDKDIVDLIDKLTCTVPYWRTLIECFVCPLLYEIRLIERRVEGDATLYGSVNSLRDLRYWLERDRDAKQAVFDRIRAVLAAWEKPAQTIEKALADNAKLIEDIRKALGQADAGKLVYDLFMKLIPLHLAIAPPATAVTTGIDKKYTELCKCDEGETDDCCGPDTGRPSVLASLIGPQPYLVEPRRFEEIVCCLAKQRYRPAKDALAEAKAELEKTDNDIKRLRTDIEEKRKSLEKSAKTELIKPFDCCKDKDGDKPKDDKPKDHEPDGGTDYPPTESPGTPAQQQGQRTPPTGRAS